MSTVLIVALITAMALWCVLMVVLTCGDDFARARARRKHDRELGRSIREQMRRDPNYRYRGTYSWPFEDRQ